jgi:hypothetical protein
MFTWLNGEGAALKNHIPGQTNYLTQLRYRRSGEDENPERTGPSRPFPLNPSFVSEPILSEELRNEIYERVVRKKKSVRAVSVELGIDMRRVGAVVRLVELEKRMRQQVLLPYPCFILCLSVVLRDEIYTND